ncbi:MAG TPA: threonine synthase [Candidatus Binataceae bacterium]|jgi:threonine synthase|nr:threonine synthase [Candidatus Binataceae bacterium]
MAGQKKTANGGAARLTRWPGLIEHYRRFLPVTDKTPVVTLNEGNTPLIESTTIAERVGPNIKVYFKFEGLNPTGSFKDRGMTLAISKALGEGARAVICASTGNTAASAAAYAGRAGLKAFVLIPKGAVALGKLSQSVMHGARVIEVVGNFDICLKVVRDLAERDPVKIRLVNSVNPDRIAGQKTAAFEVCDQLGDAPTHHFLPVGNAGNITAYWAGYREYKEVGLSTRLPRMMGYQAAESAPIVVGHPIDDPKTVATAIKIGNPASWKGATAARDESAGVIDMVTDAEILAAYRLIATTGVFAEPASAASVAGLLKYGGTGLLRPGSVVVCTLTGHGLKDPDTALKNLSNTIVVEPDINKVLKILENE